jgi:putative lipoic acid-binding regulatory protein
MKTHPLERLRETLLETESFPLKYTHKIIGKNSERFRISVAQCTSPFENASCTQERTSQNGNHVSLTFEVQAETADHVVEFIQATLQIEDLILSL